VYGIHSSKYTSQINDGSRKDAYNAVLSHGHGRSGSPIRRAPAKETDEAECIFFC